MNNNIYVHIMGQAIENVRLVLNEADRETLDLIQDQIGVLDDLLYMLTNESDSRADILEGAYGGTD